MGRQKTLSPVKTPTLPAQKSADHRSYGLKRQLVSRFAVVFLFAALIGALAALGGYRLITSETHRQNADNKAQHIQRHLHEIALEWENSAIKLKTQIDFMRLLAGDDPKRWLKLRAYLTALEGGVKNYDSVLILRRDGSLAFASGAKSEHFNSANASALNETWHLGEHRDAFYRVSRQRLWLGDEGNGNMLFLRPIENATLTTLAPPNTELYLLVDGKVIASSIGTEGFSAQINPDFSGSLEKNNEPVEQRSILISGNKSPSVHLIMRASFPEPLGARSIVVAAVLLLALTSLMLWLVLGRWLRQVSRRIRQLSAATRMFAEKHAVDKDILQSLSSPLAVADEIMTVSATCLEMMQSSEQHEEEHQAYIQTLNILEEAVVEIDRNGQFMRASPGWQKLSNCDFGECSTLYDCLHPEDVDMVSSQMASLFSGEKQLIKGRTRLTSKDGHEPWLEYQFIPAISGEHGMHTVRGVLRDITQSYQLEKRVTYMALHDALTGLPNRVLLEDRCDLSLNMAERTGHKVAVGFIDLDHFKNINDSFGHKTGDRLLIALSNALKHALRSGDTLARWGGDEFIVLLPDLPDLDSIRQAAQKLVDVCAQPIVLDDNVFNVTFSLGFAVYPDDANNAETLLSQADRAMFHAKEQGRNNVQFFCDMTSKGLGKKEVYIQNLLSSAIKNHQIQTWFQPLVDARSHRVIGVEALARWHDEEHGWISPATFIPMAENLGLISELGDQVWLETLRQGKRWRDMGCVELKLAVNVSRRQLFLPSFAATLLENLEQFNLPPSAIILEITESVALSDPEFTSKRLKELKDAGFTLAIDDFGTGYSSLSQLHHMPASKIKIDISFVRRVHEPQGAELIQAIIHMAEAFGLQCVAEGVEDEQTAQVLQQYGVHFLQGYFFGKPMPAAEIDAHLTGKC